MENFDNEKLKDNSFASFMFLFCSFCIGARTAMEKHSVYTKAHTSTTGEMLTFLYMCISRASIVLKNTHSNSNSIRIIISRNRRCNSNTESKQLRLAQYCIRFGCCCSQKANRIFARQQKADASSCER